MRRNSSAGVSVGAWGRVDASQRGAGSILPTLNEKQGRSPPGTGGGTSRALHPDAPAAGDAHVAEPTLRPGQSSASGTAVFHLTTPAAAFVRPGGPPSRMPWAAQGLPTSATLGGIASVNVTLLP